nr:uncharacterized protein LOC129265408 [Lytechinus pictus]
MAVITKVGVYWIIFTCLQLGRKASDDANTTEAQSFTNTNGSQANDGEYIGCYPELKSCLGKKNHSTILTSNSPDSCTTKCKEDGFTFAALFNRTGCACSCQLQQACINKDLPKESCGLPCPTNLEIFCGGFLGNAVYRVTSENTSNSECGNHNDDYRDPGRNDSKDPKVTKGPDIVGFSRILIVAGIGATVIIALIVIFACSRKLDRRVIYSPRDHSSRLRAHATSQEHEERPPTNQETPGDKPELPPRSLGGMQQISGADSEQSTETLNDGCNTDVEMPVLESNFYHVLAKEDNIEMDNGGLSPTSENAYAYADCQSYMDSFARSAAFIQRQNDMTPYHEDTEEIEHEMINNELYAISHK